MTPDNVVTICLLALLIMTIIFADFMDRRHK